MQPAALRMAAGEAAYAMGRLIGGAPEVSFVQVLQPVELLAALRPAQVCVRHMALFDGALALCTPLPCEPALARILRAPPEAAEDALLELTNIVCCAFVRGLAKATGRIFAPPAPPARTGLPELCAAPCVAHVARLGTSVGPLHLLWLLRPDRP